MDKKGAAESLTGNRNRLREGVQEDAIVAAVEEQQEDKASLDSTTAAASSEEPAERPLSVAAAVRQADEEMQAVKARQSATCSTSRRRGLAHNRPGKGAVGANWCSKEEEEEEDAMFAMKVVQQRQTSGEADAAAGEKQLSETAPSSSKGEEISGDALIKQDIAAFDARVRDLEMGVGVSEQHPQVAVGIQDNDKNHPQVGAFGVGAFCTNTNITESDDENPPLEAASISISIRSDMLAHRETIASAVTREDLVQEVRDQILSEAPTAEIVPVSAEEDRVEDKKQGKRRPWKTLAILAIFFLVLLLLAILVPTMKNKKTLVATDIITTPPLATTVPPTASPTKQYGNSTIQTSDNSTVETPGLVYVVNMQVVNFCGHEHHRAIKCGGHLASITSVEEKLLIDELNGIAKSLSSTTYKGIWIGGEQDVYSRNDTASKEDNVVWSWTDHSPWFDGVHTREYWAEGQPNNRIDELYEQTKGEHNLFLTQSGEYIDEHGCFGFLAPKAPGIYILPTDYKDKDKYPECENVLFLEEHEIPVPVRPDPEWVYVLAQTNETDCTEGPTWAAKCSGTLASITNTREEVIVNSLRDTALSEMENVDGVWIGEDYSTPANKSTEEGIWVLNREGGYEENVGCSQSSNITKKLPFVFMLPFDYTNRSKYRDCRTESFTKVVPVPPHG